MYRKGQAKLHAFGSGDFEEFKVTDLNPTDQKKIKEMFPKQRIGYDELRDYVFKRLEEDDDMLIGDVVYIPTGYLSRPYYGFGIIYFNEEEDKKSISFDEGHPYIPYKNQIMQLRKNKVTYYSSYYWQQMPAYPYWDVWDRMWVDDGLYATLK